MDANQSKRRPGTKKNIYESCRKMCFGAKKKVVRWVSCYLEDRKRENVKNSIYEVNKQKMFRWKFKSCFFLWVSRRMIKWRKREVEKWRRIEEEAGEHENNEIAMWEMRRGEILKWTKHKQNMYTEQGFFTKLYVDMVRWIGHLFICRSLLNCCRMCIWHYSVL